MTHYLITLTPVGMFFFGGEQTFGDGINDNYYARSNPFPQQTTLLGMLRKEVLVQEGVFKEKMDYSPDDRKRMAVLIGDKSFDIESKSQDFGKIKSLSPVFIQTNDAHYITTPLDYGMSLTFMEGRARAAGGLMDSIPFFKDYKAKEGLPDSFISSDLKIRVDAGSVLKKTVKVGIDKDRSEDDDGKFFKHQFYTMAKGYAFGFFAELETRLANSIVYMGADSSSFEMTVQKAEHSFESLFAVKSGSKKITLLSDAFVNSDIYKSCIFTITGTTDFRNIKTSSGSYEFKKEKSKSGKYTFLRRGSVLFAREKDRDEVCKRLSKPNLMKIGYNYFI